MTAAGLFDALPGGHLMAGIFRIYPQLTVGAALAVAPAASYINRFALKDSSHALA